ncbi:hypothetical protein [Enterococcus faecalis]|uniref:hypothetical protein n=1 Tax=Enterococcus faecalis TaxID=1351 RepID=UPI001F5ADEAB|nr:hypothetical protein [Enterococcus faecalis]
MMNKKSNYNPKRGFLVRGIDEVYISKIDKKAEALSIKLGRKVSREEYIRMILESDNAMSMYELQKKLLEETIDRFTRIMEIQNDTFERYIESNEMLIELMTGISIEDLRGVNSDD